ncbi:MAG: twin-arginine translocation signal domain-containing protein [Ignavibacteriaceae bacterium]
MKQKKSSNKYLSNTGGISRRKFLQTGSLSAAAIAANSLLGSGVERIFAEGKKIR